MAELNTNRNWNLTPEQIEAMKDEKIKQDNESMSVSRETLGECYETR